MPLFWLNVNRDRNSNPIDGVNTLLMFILNPIEAVKSYTHTYIPDVGLICD